MATMLEIIESHQRRPRKLNTLTDLIAMIESGTNEEKIRLRRIIQDLTSLMPDGEPGALRCDRCHKPITSPEDHECAK